VCGKVLSESKLTHGFEGVQCDIASTSREAKSRKGANHSFFVSFGVPCGFRF
jgi:hypothetical protein